MRILDFFAPRRRRCIVLGCTGEPNGRSNLCVDHELELGEKLKRAVERLQVNRRVDYACTCGWSIKQDPGPVCVPCVKCGGVAVRQSGGDARRAT